VNQASNVKHALAFVGDLIPEPTRKTRATAEGGTKEGRFYKPLPKEFRRGGFTYKQIAREGNAAIYSQSWGGSDNPAVCFEVIRIRRREGFRIGDRFVEPAEVYPKSEGCGADGFTFTNRDNAWVKFFEISLGEPAKRGKGVNWKWENPTKNS
jgi:hypothetical protein